MGNSAQLTCEKLSLGYEGKAIVEDINFTIYEGDYLCIIGENGAGKSTLMKTILGLKKPIKGDIILGNNLHRKEFGYLTQQNDIQKDFPASVKEIVYSGLQSKCGIRPFYNKQEKKIAEEAMKKMNVLSFQNECFRELSGGQQQRVLLSRALCATQKILFLDEPVAGLDPNVTKDFYSVIENLNKQDGITIVMISHDLDSTLQYASHILHIGKTTYFSTKEDYLNSDQSHIFKLTTGGVHHDISKAN